jgi:hypothetical protein
MTLLSSISSIASIVTMVFYLHPIHVSVTEIEHDEKDKRLEIMMRVFIDDLELTLRNKLNQPDLDILEPKNGLTVDQMVSDYLKERFKITLDGKLQKINYLGHEREDEAFIFYIEVSNVKKVKTIEVKNDIITEMHDDQSNLVHVTIKGDVKSLRLTRNMPSDKLTFDPK